MSAVLNGVWTLCLLAAVAVFVVGMSIGLSGDYGKGIAIVAADLAFVQMLKPR